MNKNKLKNERHHAGLLTGKGVRIVIIDSGLSAHYR